MRTSQKVRVVLFYLHCMQLFAILQIFTILGLVMEYPTNIYDENEYGGRVVCCGFA